MSSLLFEIGFLSHPQKCKLVHFGVNYILKAICYQMWINTAWFLTKATSPTPWAVGDSPVWHVRLDNLLLSQHCKTRKKTRKLFIRKIGGARYRLTLSTFFPYSWCPLVWLCALLASDPSFTVLLSLEATALIVFPCSNRRIHSFILLVRSTSNTSSLNWHEISFGTMNLTLLMISALVYWYLCVWTTRGFYCLLLEINMIVHLASCHRIGYSPSNSSDRMKRQPTKIAITCLVPVTPTKAKWE